MNRSKYGNIFKRILDMLVCRLPAVSRAEVSMSQIDTWGLPEKVQTQRTSRIWSLLCLSSFSMDSFIFIILHFLIH